MCFCKIIYQIREKYYDYTYADTNQTFFWTMNIKYYKNNPQGVFMHLCGEKDGLYNLI